MPSLVPAPTLYFCPAFERADLDAPPPQPSRSAVPLTAPGQPRTPACPQSQSPGPHPPPLFFTASASPASSTHQPTIQVQAPQSCHPRGDASASPELASTSSVLLEPTPTALWTRFRMKASLLSGKPCHPVGAPALCLPPPFTTGLEKVPACPRARHTQMATAAEIPKPHIH